MSRRTLVTILTWNKLDVLKKTIDSFVDLNPHEEFDLIVLDNGSSDGTKEYLKNNNIAHILHDANVGIYKGTMILWEHAYRNKYNFILNLQNDFISIHRTPLRKLEEYLDINSDVGFVRLNDKKDKSKNSVTNKKIVYTDKTQIDEFEVCKFNYHFTFNPCLFRTSYVPFFTKEPLDLKREKNELILQKRYDQNVGLLGARIMSNYPFQTFPANHKVNGWHS
jgi:glycosyltransferase involved in cell wall biosynthesis